MKYFCCINKIYAEKEGLELGGRQDTKIFKGREGLKEVGNNSENHVILVRYCWKKRQAMPIKVRLH